jgi:hypothetical protein
MTQKSGTWNISMSDEKYAGEVFNTNKRVKAKSCHISLHRQTHFNRNYGDMSIGVGYAKNDGYNGCKVKMTQGARERKLIKP